MKKEVLKTIKKMWKNPRQKAILKLGMWGCFFVIIAILVSAMNLFSKPMIKQPPKEEDAPIKKGDVFPSLEQLWQDLEQKEYNYSYQILERETNEILTYQGTKKNSIEEGYRESKLGIIKYRITPEKTYQILFDQEEEIENLFKPEDESYLSIAKLQEKTKTFIPEENTISSLKYLTFLTEQEKMVITINTTSIVSIEIEANNKHYQLEFTMLKE